MIESEEEEKGSRLILPRVGGQAARQQRPSILEVLSVLSRKREEFEEELGRQEPSDQSYSLKYARCETGPAPLDRTPLAEEEALARGSIA